MKFVLKNLDDTQKLANCVLECIASGEVILLNGELGAGKTTFVQAFARGAGVDEPVTSPTFIIQNQYEATFAFGPGTLLHLDAYRLSGPLDLEEVGTTELLERQCVALVEWGSIVEKCFIDPRSIEFTLNRDESRIVNLEGFDTEPLSSLCAKAGLSCA